MKSLLRTVIAVGLSGLALCAQGKDWTSIRIGVEGAYPPFSSVAPDGTLVGFDVDIAHALCKQLGAKCTLVQQDWDGIIPALLARKYDAIVASVSITAERKMKVAFSDRYYSTPARFVRKKGSNITIDKASLQGKAVGVQRATTHDNFVTTEFGDGVQIKRYANLDEGYLDAVAGRLDLLLADSVAIQDAFLATEAGKGWEFVGPGYTDAKYFGEGVGIAMRKTDAELVALFNEALATILANGAYKAINDKYFDFDVYGK